MQRYQNRGGNSGVTAYGFSTDSITLQFLDGSVYRYGREKCGRRHVEAMKRLARRGKGLATYLNVHVREKGAERLE